MNDSWLIFHSAFPMWAIITGLILLVSFLLWQEYKRKLRFLLWRIIAVIMLAFSISGLLLQPSLTKEIKSDGFVLLTSNYNVKQADSLRVANRSLVFLRTNDADPYNNANVIPLGDRTKIFQFILGDGLPEYEMQQLKNGFNYLKGLLPYGIVDLVTPSIVKVNQPNTISGVFHSRGKAILKLKGPEGVMDSVQFSGERTHPFEFSFTTKQPGLFLYEIVIEEGKEVTAQKFPVEIEDEKKLSVLICTNYPTAEVRNLKNFLTEKNHSLVVRSQVSKSNFNYEYANHETIKIPRFSSEVLKNFDLLIVDNELLESLSSFEKTQLEESVKQGLGLLVLYNSMSNNRTGSTFLSISSKPLQSDTVRIRLSNSNLLFSCLPAQVTDLYIEPITKTGKRILSGYINKGTGKIGFQLLQQTYRLSLEGKKAEYAELWSSLIEQSSRAQESQSIIKIDHDFPIYPDEPLDISLITSSSKPQLKSDNVLLPLREDIVIDDYWHGTSWAGKVGWHSFAIDTTSARKNYYVSDQKEWQALRITQQQLQNEIASSKELANAGAGISIENKPLSPIIFFLTFMMAAGFLWLAPKL